MVIRNLWNRYEWGDSLVKKYSISKLNLYISYCHNWCIHVHNSCCKDNLTHNLCYLWIRIFLNLYRLQAPNCLLYRNWKVQDLSICLCIQCHYLNMNQRMLHSDGYIGLHWNISITSFNRPYYRVIPINNSYNRR